jgi:AcrR family transcriptional regulator
VLLNARSSVRVPDAALYRHRPERGKAVDRPGQCPNLRHAVALGTRVSVARSRPAPKRAAVPSPDEIAEAGWIAAAREALVAEGVAAIQVDRLARRLGVTRGVFHWRFAGLPALLEAVLADWRDTDSVTVLAALEGSGSSRRRFQDLMRVSIEQAGDSPASDRAVRKWWRTDPAVPATVTEVDGRRLAAFETLFRDAGYPPREALPRARISCCDQVGYDARRAGGPQAAMGARRNLSPYPHRPAGTSPHDTAPY